MDDEFSLIEELFKPLCGEGSLDLGDDVAWLSQALSDPSGLVISKDLLVCGTHFFADDPYELIARKALRVNISDIVAKGAVPFGYFLGCIFPRHTKREQLEKFTSGLAQDQAEYDLHLLGGDTTRHGPADGPLTISVTILGKPCAPRPVLRQGAKPGDLVFVTGAIGASCLGLAVRQGQLKLAPSQARKLMANYLLPDPPVALVQTIARYASASLDISDGLIADAGHLAAQSAISIRLNAHSIPLDIPTGQWLAQQPDWRMAITHLASGGDDYQTLCTVPAEVAALFVEEAAARQINVAQIGLCEVPEQIPSIRLDDRHGNSIPVSKPGYRHF